MQDEMNSLYENKTWVLVEKPKDKKVINNCWVFVKKLNPDGTERYKARLVINCLLYTSRQAGSYQQLL